MYPKLKIPFINGRHSTICEQSPANRALYRYWHGLHKLYLANEIARTNLPDDLHTLTTVWQQNGYPYLKEELATEKSGFMALRTKVLAALNNKNSHDIYTIAKKVKLPIYMVSCVIDLLLDEGSVQTEPEQAYNPISSYKLSAISTTKANPKVFAVN